MTKLLSYSGIVTKIHAMDAALLKPDQYREIINLTSVTDLVSYLRRQPAYAYAFASLDDHLIHRGDIEKLLIQSLYHDYMKLYRFADPALQQFLLLYMKRYEVDLINYCFRIVFNHYTEPFDLIDKKPFFDKYSQISIEKLITSRTIEELVDNLKGTTYYEPLNRLRKTRASTLFDYNLALDLYYYSSIWKEKNKKLKGQSLIICTKYFGTKIDFLNLQWIYRAKKYYHMTSADIYSLLIPIHYKIRTPLFRLLVEAATIEEFNVFVYQTYYCRRYKMKQNMTLENIYSDYLYRLFRTDSKNNPYSITTINNYLFLKEEEIKKITTALECIRYKLGPGDTLRYVGGVTQ